MGWNPQAADRRRGRVLGALLLAGGLVACEPLGGHGGGGSYGQAPGSTDTSQGDTGGELPRCAPVVEVEQPYVLEGEEVRFSARCSEPGARRDDFEASLPGAPGGSSFDEGTWSFRWETGLADAGRYDLLLSVRPRGSRAFPETATATFWVADDWSAPGNVPVDPETYDEEWGLPVVHLYTSGSLSQEYSAGRFFLLGQQLDGWIKVRGAVSVNYPKQSYTLKFKEDLDAGELGLGRKNHLYLITTFDDDSYVRQKLAFDLWRALADYWGADRLTPRTFFTVVYLDGQYHGLYMGCERIDDDFVSDMGVSGDGNLYKAVNHDANFYRWDASGNPKDTLHDGYEKKEGEPPEGEEGAFWDLEELVAFSADTEHEAFVEQAADWIRVDEFMDWLVFVHSIAADDSGGKNSYIYNDPSNWEFRYCPWDFNHSFGQGWYTYRISPDTYNDFRSANGIFNHFLSLPETEEELWDRLRAPLEDGPLSWDWFERQLDGYYELIDRSARRDWAYWGASYQDYWGAYNPNDYEAEKAYLYDWIAKRVDYLRKVHAR